MSEKKLIQITLVKSLIGTISSHRGLVIKRRGHVVNVLDTPENWGMINKIRYLLKVEL